MNHAIYTCIDYVKVLEQKCSWFALKYLSLKQREVLHLRPKLEYGNMFDPNPVVSAELGYLFKK